MKFAKGRTQAAVKQQPAPTSGTASAALQQSPLLRQQAAQLMALRQGARQLLQREQLTDVAQQLSLEEEEPMQGKFAVAQQAALEEEEPLQGKFAVVQQAALEEEEPLQGKFEPAAVSQRQAEASNNTGMPNQLKSGIESLSGYAMDDVKVHYNSAKPAQMQAHAYAQGTDIHLAPGQEKHLPHEAWHVVQQKQGRVKATTQLKGEAINDDPGLEHEADVMGVKALSASQDANPLLSVEDNKPQSNCVPQREVINGTLVVKESGYACFAIGGKKYHINEGDPKHVTCDSDGRTHYYFEGSGTGITGVVGPGKNKKSGKQVKFKFEALPAEVKTFIKNNYDAIVTASETGNIVV